MLKVAESLQTSHWLTAHIAAGTELPEEEQERAAQAAMERRFVQRKPKVAVEDVNEAALSGVFGTLKRKKAKTH